MERVCSGFILSVSSTRIPKRQDLHRRNVNSGFVFFSSSLSGNHFLMSKQDEAEFEELAFTSPSLSIVNVMCDAVTVHFELTDGNGEVITKDQELYPDSISLPVPETFPVTGNATFSDGSSLVFVLSGKDRILVSKADNGALLLFVGGMGR